MRVHKAVTVDIRTLINCMLFPTGSSTSIAMLSLPATSHDIVTHCKWWNPFRYSLGWSHSAYHSSTSFCPPDCPQSTRVCGFSYTQIPHSLIPKIQMISAWKYCLLFGGKFVRTVTKQGFERESCEFFLTCSKFIFHSIHLFFSEFEWNMEFSLRKEIKF